MILDYLCEECAAHFEAVKACLDAADIAYDINPALCGDWITTPARCLNSSPTRWARRRWSAAAGGTTAVEELGGPHLPSLGFGMGLERLLMIMKAKECAFPTPPVCELYLAPMGEAAARRCFAIATRLREGGVSVECDIAGRGLKAQMKYADKLGARYSMVVGDNELAEGKARLKDMKTGEQTEVALDDSLYTTLYNRSLDRQLADMTDLFSELAETGE